MPIMLETPVLISTVQETVEYISLSEKNAVTVDAAIAILYYVNNSSQGGSGYWLCADKWFPGVDENTLVQNTGWAMEAYDKRMFLANLGLRCCNPDNYIWCGTYAGSPQVYCVGYFTYDEVAIFPEVKAVDRSDYTFNTDTGTGGWGSNTEFGAENIWNIPTMRQLGDKPPTGLIIDAMYDNMIIEPRNLNKSLLSNAVHLKTSCNIAGFNANGDIWVKNTAGISALMGYVTAPMVWYGVDNTIPKYTQTWIDAIHTTLEVEDDSGFAIVDLLDTTMESWYVRGTHYSQDVTPLRTVGTTRPRGRQSVIAPVDSINQFLAYGNSQFDTGPYKNIIKGYFARFEMLDVDGALDLGEEEFTAPEFYYPPDNIGSLHINYSVAGGQYSYPYVEDLVLYLSGGGTNTDPNLALGGGISTGQLSSGLNALFDDGVTIDSYVGIEHYRCLYLKNESAADTAVDVRLWIEKLENLSTSNTVSLGPDPAGINSTAQEVENDAKAPEGVTFYLANSEESCYTSPILSPGEYIAVWFKRDFILRAEETASPDNVLLHISVLNDGV